MAIEITLRPRKYTLDELRELYARYSTDDRDFNEWLSAMQITRQLLRREDSYIPAEMSTEKKATRPYYKTFEAELAGGSSEARYPRFGISTQIKEKTRIDPTDMRLIQYKDKRGRWVDVPEQPKLSLQAPRNRYEKWRAEIVGLKGVRSKYPIIVANTKKGIKGTQLKVRISGTITRYFSPLRLWGFNVESMVTFGITREKAKNPRDLELHGYKFPVESNGAITKEMARANDQSCEVMKEWLAMYNAEYYNLLESSANELCEGVAIDPVVNTPETKTEIRLKDNKAKTVNVDRAIVSAKLPSDWYEMSPSEVAIRFKSVSDDIDGARGYHGRSDNYYKLKSGQTTLGELFGGKEGEGFAKRRKRKR